MGLERADLLQIYYFMRLTRAMEDRIRMLFLQGHVVGGVYTAQGHEATIVGAASMLRNGDCIVPQHRDLGMHLVRGGSPRAMMYQWLARGNSPTLGRDGQMHIGDMHHGVVPMISFLLQYPQTDRRERENLMPPLTPSDMENSTRTMPTMSSGFALDESLPVACGVALTMKMRKRSTVVLASCGDGATNTGAFHEAMNFAAVQKLPLVLLIENNGYAFSTPTYKQFAIPNLSECALAYGIPGESVDGNDVLAVTKAVERALEHARSGKGPALVECKTFRVRGHSEADKADYVPKELREEWLARDPIARFEAYFIEHHMLTPAQKAEIEVKVKAVVDDAVRFAEQSPPPDQATMAEYVFAPDGPIAIVGEPGSTNPRYINALDRRTGEPFNTMSRAEEVVGRI